MAKMVDVQKYAKRLKGRLLELNERLEDIEQDLDEPVNPDAEERATEREGDEVLENLGNAGLVEIKKIQAALARIDKGTFGVCVSCEEPISNERLEVLPHAARCRHCT